MALHEMKRVRHDIVLRMLEVSKVQAVSPKMVRVTLTGEALQGFASPSPDDHVKVFIPLPGHTRPTVPIMTDEGPRFADGVMPSPARDYTPRRYDPQAGELTIDFVLHGDGPGSTWASQAEPGQLIAIGGPRGSWILPDDFDTYVMVGDETALPSIGRRLEELPSGARAITFIEVADRAEVQPLESRAEVEQHWFFRDGAEPGTTRHLEDAVRALEFPAGDTFVWIGAESRTMRAIRRHLQNERGHNPDWIKAAAYWKLRPDEEDGDE